MKILHVDSSILSEGSISRQLTAFFGFLGITDVSFVRATVTHIDLAVTPLTHLTAAHLGAAQGAPVPPALEADVAASKGALDGAVRRPHKRTLPCGGAVHAQPPARGQGRDLPLSARRDGIDVALKFYPASRSFWRVDLACSAG
jgi:hypothetical protein